MLKNNGITKLFSWFGQGFELLYGLLAPRVCSSCQAKLLDEEDIICTHCRWEMPLTYFWLQKENPIYRIFYNTILLEEASAFFHYTRGSGYREMIHHMKFHGQKQTGERLGSWFAKELKDSGRYDGIDVVVPLPIHRSRFRERGYNQSEQIARGMAAVLQRPMDTASVVRAVRTKAQSRTGGKKERMENVEGAFQVAHPQSLSGKHILLVDDVVTTGSTLESCARTLQQQVPDCRISIVALAWAGLDK